MSGLGGEEDKPSLTDATTSEIAVVGRTVFNLWRLLRSELSLTSHTMEAVARVVLGQRRPHFSFVCLTQWWADARSRKR